MAQHDYNIANQIGLEFRADLNNALQAIVTENSGTTAPATTFPGMKWRDTSVSPSVLKKRNDANNAWDIVSTSIGEAISGATTTASQRSALGLGTAATLNAGTSANNVVQLDGTGKLPAVDGSALTNLPSTGLAAASTSEAQAGTSNTVAITPLRLREGLNATGSAPIYACRAWVNFNGTGTPTIRSNGNVSSITDNGTGDYTVNFTNAMPDANYGYSLSSSSNANTANGVQLVSATTAGIRFTYYQIGVGNVDVVYAGASIFR